MHRWFVLAVCLLAITAAAEEPVPSPAPAATPAPPARRVEIDKTKQVLRAYEGDKLVLETHVSTGKWDKSTPNGSFIAGNKERMHFSKLFQNAPMPYSVWVTGDVFIHGFSVVPRSPASHGCIRVPLDKGNPAKKFFDWIEPGTPIDIIGHWEG